MFVKTQVVDIRNNTNTDSFEVELEGHDEELITGRTTLKEAAIIGNIPVEQLIDKLNLPRNIDPEERLGRLKREYGFEIQDVREAILQD